MTMTIWTDVAGTAARAAPLMLDLFAGRGGASAAMRDRGWQVIRIDNDPDMQPDIVADLATWTYSGPRPDLVWASPPCQEFARESMPWSRTGCEPALDLVMAAMRIIKDARPRFWAIENVRGAAAYLTPLLGTPQRIGPWYVWSNLPPLPQQIRWIAKERFSSRQRDLRAKIPYGLSHAVAALVESQHMLFDTDMEALR